MEQDGKNNKNNPPPASTQALFDGMSAASRQIIESIVSSLTPAQRSDSSEMLRALTAGMQADTEHLAELQQRYYRQHLELWTNLARTGDEAAAATPVAVPDKGDRRFHAPEWQKLPYFDYLKQAYLINSRWLSDIVEATQLAPAAKNKLRFFTRQLIDAAAPVNFAPTNPEVIKLAAETKGESLARGLEHLSNDAKKGRISMTDESAFEIGRNIAVTPGTVVYENDVMQLIQYAPSTPTVYSRPLVMVPPCINKFYILDLQPENSFAAYAVSEGHTVFMVSWRNVGPEHGHYGWDDYLELGVFAALRVAREITKADKVNALGFCVGGTLLGAGLAVMAAKGEDTVESVTFLAAMLDFSETGQIGLFVDETSVATREATIGKSGILPGSELSFVFSSLRANDLIWPYVVNNYLLGGKPAAFDLLYWNADSTNLPGPMYCYYVRNTYLENKLRVPGALSNCGVPVDLATVKLPMFGLATREDHIVPWRSAYRTLNIVGGEDKTFVLGASGHIAGVVNPASKNRRSHWIGAAYPHDPQAWLEQAGEHKGSWWPRWMK